MRKAAAKIVICPLTGALWVYRYAISPFLGINCRFQPTCSEYARDALQIHGLFRGSGLALRRVLRCHPLGGSGYDPVPPGRGPREPGEHRGRRE